MRLELAFHPLVGGLHDGLAQLGVELAQRHVDLGRGALDHPQRPHDGQRLLLPADLEIVKRALGLRAPILVGRDLDGAEGVGFGAGLAHSYIFHGFTSGTPDFSKSCTFRVATVAPWARAIAAIKASIRECERRSRCISIKIAGSSLAAALSKGRTLPAKRTVKIRSTICSSSQPFLCRDIRLAP